MDDRFYLVLVLLKDGWCACIDRDKSRTDAYVLNEADAIKVRDRLQEENPADQYKIVEVSDVVLGV